MSWIQPPLQCHNGIIFSQGFGWGCRDICFRFSRLWVHVGDFHGPFGNAGSNSLKDETLSVRNLEEGQILNRRTDENEIVILGIVQREKAPAFNANALVKLRKDVVQSMDGEHFADPCVVIQYACPCVLTGVIIAHSCIRTPDESRIAKDDPRFLRAGDKSSPEDLKNRRDARNMA